LALVVFTHVPRADLTGMWFATVQKLLPQKMTAIKKITHNMTSTLKMETEISETLVFSSTSALLIDQGDFWACTTIVCK
jgi:hypothetical protein